MKVSIIGASGFIGQNLLKSLSNSFEVKAISLRNNDWKDAIQDADVFINLIGKPTIIKELPQKPIISMQTLI